MGLKLFNGVFTNDAGKQFSTGNCYFPGTIVKQFGYRFTDYGCTQYKSVLACFYLTFIQ